MATDTAASSELSTDGGVRRRDWIHIAALSTAGVGGASLLFPLVSQMAPSKDVLAASSTDVDVGAIQPGQSIKAVFRKQPLFVKRLTPEEIAKAKADELKRINGAEAFEYRAAGLQEPRNSLVSIRYNDRLSQRKNKQNLF